MMEYAWIFILLGLIALGIVFSAFMPQYKDIAVHLGFMVALPLAIILVLGVRDEKARNKKAKR